MGLWESLKVAFSPTNLKAGLKPAEGFVQHPGSSINYAGNRILGVQDCYKTVADSEKAKTKALSVLFGTVVGAGVIGVIVLLERLL
jgi:hypothetical protein